MTVSKASDITAKLLEPFPLEVIEEKNGLLYIPHEIIRDRLISATDNQFDWSIEMLLLPANWLVSQTTPWLVVPGRGSGEAPE